MLPFKMPSRGFFTETPHLQAICIILISKLLSISFPLSKWMIELTQVLLFDNDDRICVILSIASGCSTLYSWNHMKLDTLEYAVCWYNSASSNHGPHLIKILTLNRL